MGVSKVGRYVERDGNKAGAMKKRTDTELDDFAFNRRVEAEQGGNGTGTERQRSDNGYWNGKGSETGLNEN